MTNRATLLDLAARCEAATGPDRELDAEIFGRVVLGQRFTLLLACSGWIDHEDGDLEAPTFTVSLDAALTLYGDERPTLVHSEARLACRDALIWLAEKANA